MIVGIPDRICIFSSLLDYQVVRSQTGAVDQGVDILMSNVSEC